MKKIILFASFYFIAFNMLHAQVADSAVQNLLKGTVPGVNIIHTHGAKPDSAVMELLQGRVAGLNIQILKNYSQPQISINGKLVGRNNMCINPDDIVSIRNIGNDLARSAYSVKNTDVIEITMKPGAKLLSLNEIFRVYNIPALDWTLPAFVDGKAISDRKQFIASASYIDTVCLNYDKKTINISSKRVVVKGFKAVPRSDKVCAVSRQSLLQQYVKK